MVIFDNDLSPGQVRNLEKAIERQGPRPQRGDPRHLRHRGRGTAEARLQVELAQLEYTLPRLKQMWTHLSRQKGGGIGLRGPGETQLEEDRRLVDSRIRDLKQQAGRGAGAQGTRGRAAAREELTVSLVGYTNAGKSTLMNALTGGGRVRRGQAVLDARHAHAAVAHPDWGRVLLSDTVGFIRDLPHHLVASFKATLEEARHAELLLHVVDASNPQAEEHIQAVNAVLKELGCDEQADDPGAEQDRPGERPRTYGAAGIIRSVAISAPSGGLDDARRGGRDARPRL